MTTDVLTESEPKSNFLKDSRLVLQPLLDIWVDILLSKAEIESQVFYHFLARTLQAVDRRRRRVRLYSATLRYRGW